MKQTTLCYIDDGSSYLMLHRVKKDNDASHGKWIGVGGKCEADESPDECMLREVREETGIEITKWHYRGIVTFISDTWPNEYMHLFTATEWRGEPDMSIDDEGELAWIRKADLPVHKGIGDQNITLRVKSSPVELKASHIFLPIYSYPCQSYLGTYSGEGHHQLNETAFGHNGNSHRFLCVGNLTIQDAQIHYP